MWKTIDNCVLYIQLKYMTWCFFFLYAVTKRKPNHIKKFLSSKRNNNNIGYLNWMLSDWCFLFYAFYPICTVRFQKLNYHTPANKVSIVYNPYNNFDAGLKLNQWCHCKVLQSAACCEYGPALMWSFWEEIRLRECCQAWVYPDSSRRLCRHCLLHVWLQEHPHSYRGTRWTPTAAAGVH